MGARAVRVVSGTIWSLAVTLALGGLGLSIFNRGPDSAGEFGPALGIFFVLVLMELVSLGVLVSSRRPGNPVGWIITGSGMSLIVAGFAQSYGIYALYTDPGNTPGARLWPGSHPGSCLPYSPPRPCCSCSSPTGT